MWKIEYKKSVKKDLKKIPLEEKKLIKMAIEEKLMIDPVKFGTPLRQSLKGYFKFRVGDYRIVYGLKRKTVTVLVIKIGHRKDVYKSK